jgi:hypothetical protein
VRQASTTFSTFFQASITLFEELQDKISETEAGGGLGASGRGSPLNNNHPLNNDPLNNNQPRNDGAACARLLKDFNTPQIDDMHLSIDIFTVDLNNFELKLTLINMIQQN